MRLRLWPGVVIAILLAIVRYVLPLVGASTEIFGLPTPMLAVMGGMLGGVAIAVWWLFLSRAPWPERLGAIALIIVALAVTFRIVHPSIAGGMMGMMLVVYSVPILALTLVFWAVTTSNLSHRVRWASLVAAVLVVCTSWTLVRTAGLMGGGSEFHWRWTATPEEQLLAVEKEIPAPNMTLPTDAGTPALSPERPKAAIVETIAAPAIDTPAEWPGFRGPARDSVVHGVRINTDWSASPPVKLWQRPIGPGWSSVAVHGDLLYTQEQRGEDEVVAAYRTSSGAPVWLHRDPVRFWESNGGAGPRATPTLNNHRVFAFGATGILNALDAVSGAVLWSRDVAADTDRKVPDWGFASSPLVVGDTVIVAAAGTLAAYDVATGTRRWMGPSYGGSYSSPHRATIDGVDQILLLGGPGAISVDPASGTVLWQHEWAPGAITQPALMPDGDVLVNAIVATGGIGVRRLAVARRSNAWTVEERWTSSGLKPYFNDFVVHNGHAFGFDGSILACIDLEDGQRRWKGGRYGNGQLLLLADEDVLLVSSEDGELVLVEANPDEYREVARFPALDGKTWNHPVLVGDVLIVRNGEEMAAFRLPLAQAR